jgi:hypothetical protein
MKATAALGEIIMTDVLSNILKQKIWALADYQGVFVLFL